jgi:hypothetical protein
MSTNIGRINVTANVQMTTIEAHSMKLSKQPLKEDK